MKNINKLTSLLTEIISKNYNTRFEDGNVIVRIMKNIKRYELVYYLMITVVQLIFLLIDRELLLPCLIMLISPITTIILNPYLKEMYYVWSLYPIMVMLGFVVSVLNNTPVMFIDDCLVSLGTILFHAIFFDPSPFQDVF